MKWQGGSKLAVLAVLGLMAWPLAAQEAQQMTQQERMTFCNQQAGDKKGGERKAFMKQCLSKKAAAPEKPKNQRDKMKYCNQQAGDTKGDERKTFMRECLKAD
ncbi:MAG: PsiF family protein [Burkholderiales bacterium]|jgi:hypothetical protein|nr:PsiF family protein [Burkholderiales bacterium]